MLLYIDTLLQPRRQPSEPIGAGWNQIVITWAGGGGTGMQACLALDARPRMLQQDRASERGTGRWTIWAVGELRLTPLGLSRWGEALRVAGTGPLWGTFDPPDGRSIRLHLAAAMLGLKLQAVSTQEQAGRIFYEWNVLRICRRQAGYIFSSLQQSTASARSPSHPLGKS